MRAMIMAAGLGTRLRPLTGLIPKPMAPIVNRPALYHILRLLQRHGITEVVVNLHHLPDTITSYFGDGAWLGSRSRTRSRTNCWARPAGSRTTRTSSPAAPSWSSAATPSPTSISRGWSRPIGAEGRSPLSP